MQPHLEHAHRTMKEQWELYDEYRRLTGEMPPKTDLEWERLANKYRYPSDWEFGHISVLAWVVEEELRKSEGDEPWPELMSAQAIAERLGKEKKQQEAISRQLSRYAATYPDCRVANEGRRKGEPQWLYRTADVLPHLKA